MVLGKLRFVFSRDKMVFHLWYYSSLNIEPVSEFESEMQWIGIESGLFLMLRELNLFY